jgi:hypothetical protein
MKKDKLKSLLINITSELQKLSKEELLCEASTAKNFSDIMKEANLLVSNEIHDDYRITFSSFDRYDQTCLNSYSSGSITTNSDDYALAA